MKNSRHLLYFIVSLAIFMEMLDSTILNTAIPNMAVSLQVSPINLKISLISYFLMLSIFIPISGWVADKFGAKKIFLTAMMLFTISSLGCGFAHTLTELTVMRSLQGIGGAFMTPIARLLILRSVPRANIPKALSQVMTIAVLGAMLGPVLGGFITEYLSWPWIFFLNIPVGFVTLILTHYGLKEIDCVSVPPFDGRGFVLFGLGLAFFVFGLSSFSESGFPLSYTFLFIGIALILLLFYFFHARKIPHPVIDTLLFKFNSFQIGTLGSLLTRISFGGMPFLLPLLFQLAFHYSPALSGLLLMPMAIGVMGGKPLAIASIKYLGYRRCLIWNTAALGIWVASFALLTNHTSWIIVVIQTFIFGILVSQQYSAMNALAYQELPQEKLSNATSIVSTVAQFSQSFGVALTALLLYMGLFFTGTTVLHAVVFEMTFIVLGALTLLSSLVFCRLRTIY